MSRRLWTNTFWAGQNTNSLGESIEDIARMGELRRMKNVDSSVEGYVLNLLGASWRAET